MNFNAFTSRLFGYFIRGLLVLAPVFFTGYIIFGIFNWLDSKFYFYFPGAGILIVLSVIVFIGWLGSAFFMLPVLRMLEQGLGHLPLVRLIYFSLKDLIEAFVGDKKKFNRPVIIILNQESDIRKMGFITQGTLSEIGFSGYVTVYCPHSYAFSGEMYIVPAKNIISLDLASTEAMKFIVSGGVAENFGLK